MDLRKQLDPKVEALFFEPSIEIKDVCTKCLVSKPISEFPSRGKGKRGQCKACRSAYMVEWQKKNPEKTRERINAWREKNREYIREKYRENNRIYAAKYRAENPDQYAEWNARRRARKYGVTAEWVREQTAAQNGLCGICSQPPGEKGLAVDHCHKTGQVRGLLCSHCNTGLHKMESDPVWFEKAMCYLQENR